VKKLLKILPNPCLEKLLHYFFPTRKSCPKIIISKFSEKFRQKTITQCAKNRPILSSGLFPYKQVKWFEAIQRHCFDPEQSSPSATFALHGMATVEMIDLFAH
jgi:hypothetical protein